MEDDTPPDRRTTGLIVLIVQENAGDLKFSEFLDFEDIVQECELYVNKYKHRFDPSRGEWSTFVRQIVITALPKIRISINRCNNPVDHREFEFALKTNLELRTLYAADAATYAYSTLSNREKTVVKHLVKGHRRDAIAEELGVKISRISQIVTEIRKKFHRELYA